MVSKSMRCAAKAHAADGAPSAANSTQPAAPVAAGARGVSPRADDGSPLELISSGDSDGGSNSN